MRKSMHCGLLPLPLASSSGLAPGTLGKNILRAEQAKMSGELAALGVETGNVRIGLFHGIHACTVEGRRPGNMWGKFCNRYYHLFVLPFHVTWDVGNIHV